MSNEKRNVYDPRERFAFLKRSCRTAHSSTRGLTGPDRQRQKKAVAQSERKKYANSTKLFGDEGKKERGARRFIITRGKTYRVVQGKNSPTDTAREKETLSGEKN